MVSNSKLCDKCFEGIAYYDGYFKAYICHRCNEYSYVNPSLALLEDYRRLTPIEQLNFYRNLHYKDGEDTESRIIANALNEILPQYSEAIKSQLCAIASRCE